jgi:hypothetical protein
MRSYILLVVLVMVAGCGRKEPTTTQPTVAPDVILSPEMKTVADKIVSQDEKAKQQAEAFIAGLKTNPQPLFDRATQAVKEGLAQMEGDEVAKSATITVDPKSLKTFGPNKWKVQGHLHTTQHDTTWEVELGMMFDALQVVHTSLQVK